MKAKLVFSRDRKVRRSFTIDDKIIRQYVELYGLSVKEAREKYKMFQLRMQMSNPNLYA
jgi:hypothetical protein